MPETPVKNVRRQGALRVPANVDTAVGPADEMAVLSTVVDDAVLHQKNNNGTVVEKVRGSGVKVMPVQTSTPGSLEPGMYWLQEVGGTTYLYFTDNTPTAIQVPIVAAPIVGPVALVDAVATTVDSIDLAAIPAYGVSWWVDIIDTNTAPDSHVTFRIDGSVVDATTIDWSIYGETAAFPHTIGITYGAGVANLQITASGTGFEARVRSEAL